MFATRFSKILIAYKPPHGSCPLGTTAWGVNKLAVFSVLATGPGTQSVFKHLLNACAWVTY